MTIPCAHHQDLNISAFVPMGCLGLHFDFLSHAVLSLLVPLGLIGGIMAGGVVRVGRVTAAKGMATSRRASRSQNRQQRKTTKSEGGAREAEECNDSEDEVADRSQHFISTKEIAIIVEKHASAALLVTFVFYPTTSTALFRVFQCEHFDDGSAALIADLSVRCGTERHNSHKAVAGLGVCIVALGVPICYALLFHSRA